MGSRDEVVGVAKVEVTVKAEATPMAPPLIRYAPRAEAVARNAGGPGAAVNYVIKAVQLL